MLSSQQQKKTCNFLYQLIRYRLDDYQNTIQVSGCTSLLVKKYMIIFKTQDAVSFYWK